MADLREWFGLTQIDCEKIRTVLSRNKNVEQVIVYGSRAKGNHKAGSDIDLTILGEVTWQELNKLESDLDELCLPYQFDLSLFNQIDNLDLIDHIDKVGKVFYQK